MAHYLIESKDKIFVKGYLSKKLSKVLVKTYVKSQAVNTVRNYLIILNNLAQMKLKLLQKK